VSERLWSVRQLTRAIRELLEIEFDRVWVHGEISGWKVHPSSGHAYFTLKDDKACLTCVAWATTVRGIMTRAQPRDGLSVRVYGRLTVYEPRGNYQLVVEALLPDGEGNLQAAFERLKAKLLAEGLFDPARKRPLPAFPRRIGIVTSPSGAAIRDLLHCLNQRWPVAEVVLRPAAVQGPGAARDLAEGLRDLEDLGGIDVVIIGRGGGSLEDLWAFNEEVLARAVHAAKIPVVSAVGHEVDFTICDFVADVRAATPSNAAELVVPDCREIAARLARDGRLLRGTALRHLEHCRGQLQRARLSRGLNRPEALLRDGRLDLDRLSDRLRRGLLAKVETGRQRGHQLERRLSRQDPSLRLAGRRRQLASLAARAEAALLAGARRRRSRCEVAAARLGALSPRRVLERGYSIVTRAADGRVLRSAGEAALGENLNIRLHAGRLGCTVESVDQAAEHGSNEEARI